MFDKKLKEQSLIHTSFLTTQCQRGRRGLPEGARAPSLPPLNFSELKL